MKTLSGWARGRSRRSTALDTSNRYPVLGEDDVKEAIAKHPGRAGRPRHARVRVRRDFSDRRSRRSRRRIAATSRRRRRSRRPAIYAKFIGSPVVDVPVDAKLAADLDALASAASWCRARVPVQPEQSDRDSAHESRRHGVHQGGERRVAGNHHPGR